MNNSLNKLNHKIIKCTKCDRLVKFRKKIAVVKRKQFIHETYWAKPIPGYGDSKAKLLFIGLAPAAHGGTRTGLGKFLSILFNDICNINFTIV